MHSCLRPDVDCVYTPVLDKSLLDLVLKCKTEDKVFRKTQDLLDVAGPIRMSDKVVWQAKDNPPPLDLSVLLSCLTRSLKLLGNVKNHVSAKRRNQNLSRIGPSGMNHGKLMAETCLSNSLNNSSSSGLKQQKPFPLPVLPTKESRFFREAPPKQNPGLEGVQPVKGVLLSQVRPIALQVHSGEGAEQQHSFPSQPLKTSEESSSWYRYVPIRNFFNVHSFQSTCRGQNSSIISDLADHYKRPLTSGNCGGVQ